MEEEKMPLQKDQETVLDVEQNRETVFDRFTNLLTSYQATERATQEKLEADLDVAKSKIKSIEIDEQRTKESIAQEQVHTSVLKSELASVESELEGTKSRLEFEFEIHRSLSNWREPTRRDTADIVREHMAEDRKKYVQEKMRRDIEVRDVLQVLQEYVQEKMRCDFEVHNVLQGEIASMEGERDDQARTITNLGLANQKLSKAHSSEERMKNAVENQNNALEDHLRAIERQNAANERLHELTLQQMNEALATEKKRVATLEAVAKRFMNQEKSPKQDSKKVAELEGANSRVTRKKYVQEKMRRDIEVREVLQGEIASMEKECARSDIAKGCIEKLKGERDNLTRDITTLRSSIQKLVAADSRKEDFNITLQDQIRVLEDRNKDLEDRNTAHERMTELALQQMNEALATEKKRVATLEAEAKRFKNQQKSPKEDSKKVASLQAQLDAKQEEVEKMRTLTERSDRRAQVEKAQRTANEVEMIKANRERDEKIQEVTTLLADQKRLTDRCTHYESAIKLLHKRVTTVQADGDAERFLRIRIEKRLETTERVVTEGSNGAQMRAAECINCFEVNPRAHVFLPCLHANVCESCIETFKMTRCPTCMPGAEGRCERLRMDA